MSVVTVFLLVFSIACYTVQSFFNKLYSVSYTGPSAAATPVFSLIYGIVCGIATLAANGFVFAPSPITWVFGLANGGVLFLFNLSMVSASRTGPYAFQSVSLIFGNILLPLLFSTFFWQDRLGWVKLLGIGLMLASFVLFNLKGLNFDGRKKGYFFWVALLFVSNGFYGILIDAQQRVCAQTQRNEMIIITFVTTAVISLIYLLLTQRKQALRAFRMRPKTWVFALGSSVGAMVAVNLLMILLGVIPASILYTIINGCILIVSGLLSVIVLHEKLEKCMVAGFGVAVVSLVLLSL